jgi:hypothetical protein
VSGLGDVPGRAGVTLTLPPRVDLALDVHAEIPFSSHADWYAFQSSSETRTTRFGMGSRVAMAKGYPI